MYSVDLNRLRRIADGAIVYPHLQKSGVGIGLLKYTLLAA
ncbi:hypothetical protein SAMN05444147_102293 [Pectobacterium carotovorum]|nr:hypothetical protein PEC301619_19730 [Pectobacterium carotovorum subsp. carotovorum]SHG37408.1 hypothetical protein SAMN05444147_102293 [Pectobacterium carotovorum]